VRRDIYKNLREEELEDTEHLIKHLASMLGVERKSVYRWLESGVGLPKAEEIASKLGLHPSYIWGPEYHIVTYMEELRQKFIDNNRSKKMAIRRSLQRKEKENAKDK
jgi:lambda repressor-like predicted transcriptional regulator